ncbi:MAG: DHA2 family efflux MFS transporter permease subunit [Caulobacteraceae bacterium]|nr:DHA2 family efflux MFS transporter permease subunit [Caulobacteraceae bacterium]
MGSARDVANRLPVTASVILASFLVGLDMTVANVALPHMQGSFATSQDQTAWVLTSYIVAAAVMTPMSGWLAARLGSKLIFLVSIGGFTIASALCGASNSLVEMVAFRFVQGVCGASLQPLSQAVMLDLFDQRQIGQVMAIGGMTSFVASIAGPALGGWLTEDLSWRWVFYINIPLGALAFAGVWLFMDRGPDPRLRPFDFLGFGALSVFIVSLQLMLDRGPTLDWFASTEIRIEAICAASGLWVFAVQTLAGRHPFLDRALAVDRNFLTGNFFNAIQGMLLFAALALQPPLMQGLMGYSVIGAGLVMAPRGVGAFLSMMVVGRLVNRVDSRLLVFVGLALVATAMLEMSHFSLAMDDRLFIEAGLLQGFGMALVIVPINVLAFATLSPGLQADGAAVFSLTRGLGQSIGVSLSEAILTNRLAVAHSDLAAQVQPSNPVVASGLPAAMNPSGAMGLARLNGEVTRQASMVGYVDVFHLGLILAVTVMPLVLLLRPQKQVRTLAEYTIE